MALFEKGNSKGEENAVTAKTGGGGSTDSLLGKGSEFEGKLTFKGHVRIDGKFSGQIQTDEALDIGPGAKVNAEISAGIVSVSGTVEGTIRATQVVELHKSARVKGTIEAPNVIMEREATFDGTMKMESLSSRPPPPPGTK